MLKRGTVIKNIHLTDNADEIEGRTDKVKGLVLKAGVTRSPIEIEKEIVKLVRDKLGPVAAFKLAITVGRLPKTRSGKILRGTIKKIADGDPWAMPATIEDPKVLDEIGDALAAGRLKGHEKLPAKMVLTLGGANLTYEVTDEIELG